MNAPARSLTVFIDRALEPVRPWLEDDQVVEICANGPGEVWVERFGQAARQVRAQNQGQLFFSRVQRFSAQEFVEIAVGQPEGVVHCMFLAATGVIGP